jgi:penicillin amidase
MTTEAMTAETYDGARAAVHERTVAGFGTLRVLPVDPRADLDVLHGWVTEERAEYWGMTGFSKERVLETYLHLDSLDTHHAFLMVRDGVPAALFQTYEPDADRVGECYEVRPGDIGVHLLIGPPAPGGGERPGWSSTLLAAFLAYALTGLGRQRAVVEPDARNAKAIARLTGQGFVPAGDIVLPGIDLPEVRLPEKRALLAFLTREAFEEGSRASG